MTEISEQVFVLTDSAMIHTPTCSHVAHQVTEQPRGYAVSEYAYEDAGRDADGHHLVRERHVETPAPNYRAHYVTLEQIGALTRKYRRCTLCSPDVPEWQAPPAKPTRVVARYLQARHIGRGVEGAGTLESIRVILHTSDGDVEVGIDEQVVFAPRRSV